MLGPGQGQVCTELFRILQVNEGRPWQSIHTFRGRMRSSECECHHCREGRPHVRKVVQTKLTPILYALDYVAESRDLHFLASLVA